MKLTKRLEAVASLVDQDSTCLDVGCDHAYLSIHLIEAKKALSVIASDNKEGPLDQARKNIEQKKLQDKIKISLGYGMDTIEDDIDTVIIAGMGGKTINGILKKDSTVTKRVDTFIIQPNNDQKEVRKTMMKLGFYLTEEKLVKEKKYFYQVMKFQRGKIRYSKKELFFGPKLLQNKDKNFVEYYKKEITSRKILMQLLPSNFRWKKFQVKKEIAMIEKELNI